MGTLRSQWEEIMDVCIKDGSGHEPGKTIVFAMNHKHAMRLKEAFDQVYPGRVDLAQVITNESDHKGNGVKNFNKYKRGFRVIIPSPNRFADKEMTA